MSLRVRIVLILAAVAVVASLAAGFRTYREREYRSELARAEADVAAGRFFLAKERLVRLESAWPGRAEVLFSLGVCEKEAGRVPAALDAWARVPSGTDLSARARIRRATVLTNAGRYAPAEADLRAASNERKTPEDIQDWRKAWTRLLRFEGRIGDVRRSLIDSLVETADPAAVLKDLWLLDTTSVPIDALAIVLEKADPNDDRVLLARANLALLDGSLDIATKRIRDLAARTPDDPAVQRARLEIARAGGDRDEAAEAYRRLPTDALNALETAELNAWFASKKGPADERKAWNEVLKLDPAHPTALDRLAALANEAKDRDESVKHLARKTEIDRAHDRYRKILLQETDLKPYFDELANLAKTLGRPADARGWDLAKAIGTPAEPRVRAALTDLEPAERLDGFARLDPGVTTKASPANPGTSAITFRDAAETSGLRFVFDHGPSSLRQLPETMSGGVATFDYNGDGLLDVYVVQGGPFPFKPDNPPIPGDRLFRNVGDGSFVDATVEAGLPPFSKGYGHGVAVGDYDNDGHPDLFVTRFDAYTLLRNRGDGRFEDVTEAAGLAGPKGWPTSACWADLDRDGDLDLYVCHYMKWDVNNPVVCRNDKGEPLYCDPGKAPAEPDRLYRNDAGKFIDATEAAGLVDKDGRGLGVIAADFDDDGVVDLFVANDGTANDLLRNEGKPGTLRFREVAHESGVAANADGGYHAGMGIACGDLDGDGKLDLIVTNFFGEAATLYQGLGGGLFTDRTSDSGLGAATRHRLGFGIAFLDADNDGLPDVAIANGHVNDNRPYFPYAMPPQLLRNRGAGRLVDVSKTSGEPWNLPQLGRGLAVADMDNDGRVDVLIVNQGKPLTYLHNQSPPARSLTVQLQAVATQHEAVGAKVVVNAAGRRQTAWKTAGGSYQSAGDPRFHFGLGTAEKVDSIEVRWPSGKTETWKDIPADRAVVLVEGAPAPRKMPGFR